LIVNIVNYCSTRPWRIVVAWTVLVAAALAAIAFALSDVLDSEARVPQSARTESQRANELVEARFPDAVRDDVELLVLRGGDIRRAVAALRDVGTEPVVEDVVARPDGRGSIVPFRLAGVPVEDVLPVAERLDGEVYGGAIIDRDFHEVSQSDLRRGEIFGVVAALVILLLVFGALVAALVPLVLAGVAIVVSLGLVALVGQAATLSVCVTNIV
jgi:putative drug exporter of the RND superfamily